MKVLLVVAAVVVLFAGFLSADQKLDNKLWDRLNLKHFSIRSGDVKISEAPSRNAIDDKIIAFLEQVRDQFDEGFPDSGIPPLDPFTTEHVDLSIDQKAIIKADIKLDKISLKGLQGFQIDKINFKLVGLSMEFALTIPSVIYTSLYEIDGKAGLIVPIHSDGVARFGMTDLTIVGKANMGTTEGGFLTLKTFEVDFDAASVSLYLSGLIGDGQINEIFNWVLNQLSDDFFQGQRERLAEFASAQLYELVNEALSKISLSDLVG